MSQGERFAVGYLLICWMVFCAYKLVQEFIKGFKGEKINLNSTYTKLIEEIVYYCADLYRENKIKHYPQFEVSYYESKKTLGIYYPSRKKILIYVNAHQGEDRIKQIIHTTLHECFHYRDHLKEADFKNYDYYTKEAGYSFNKYEISANKFANKNLEDCIKHLKQKGIVS
jgi:hypothetical protein